MDLQFKRLNLKEGDSLVVEVSSSGLTEDEIQERLKSVREDEFTKFVEDKGHKVFVTYTGVNLNILRMQENDKLAVYVDTTVMDQPTETKYIDYIKSILSRNIEEEKLVVIPQKEGYPQLGIVQMRGNEIELEEGEE